jgi:tetratricopeptide (TPR) repeat protein
MQRHSRNVQLLAVLLVVLFCPGGARSQSERLLKDPVLGPILKAEGEERLADAKKLIEAAIQGAETKPSPDPRLRLLLSHLANVDSQMGHTADAIAVTKHLLKMDENLYGAESANIVSDLNNLGAFYRMAGDEAAAGQTFERELAAARKSGAMLLVAIGNLSSYYLGVHRAADAKALLAEAVEICDTQPGVHFPDCSDFRSRLADVYRSEGRAADAEAIVSSGAAQTVGVGPDWFTQVQALNTLARQYEQSEVYDLAEATYRQAIALIEKSPYSQKDPAAPASEVFLLAQLFEKEGRSFEAEEAYKRVLAMQERAAGPEHPYRAASLLGSIVPLVALYRTEGRLSELEPILQEALALQERVLGPDHVKIADTLLELANMYQDEEKYADAEPLYRRAITIQEKSYGPDAPALLRALNPYAELLRKLDEPDKAEAVAARAAALRQKLDQQTPKSPPHN